MNKCIFIGRLTRDPEVRYTQVNNTLVCSFALAVARRTKQEGQPDADFFNIVAWSKTGEFCSKYFKKGQQIGLVGHLQTRFYDDKDGKRVYVTEVIAEEVYFAGGNSEKNQNEQNNQEPNFMKEDFTPVTDDDLPF